MYVMVNFPNLFIWFEEYKRSYVMDCHTKNKEPAIKFNWRESLTATMTMLYHTITWSQQLFERSVFMSVFL